MIENSCWSDDRFSPDELTIKFSGSISEKYICCVCHGVIKEPVECINGHCIGKHCAEKLVKKYCPLCRVSMLPLQRSNFLNSLISGLTMLCSNKGCYEYISVNRIMQHENWDCSYRTTTCGVCNKFTTINFLSEHTKFSLCTCGLSVTACKQVFLKDHFHFRCFKCYCVISSIEEMQDHVANVCRFREKICVYCGLAVNFNFLC